MSHVQQNADGAKHDANEEPNLQAPAPSIAAGGTDKPWRSMFHKQSLWLHDVVDRIIAVSKTQLSDWGGIDCPVLDHDQVIFHRSINACRSTSVVIGSKKRPTSAVFSLKPIVSIGWPTNTRAFGVNGHDVAEMPIGQHHIPIGCAAPQPVQRGQLIGGLIQRRFARGDEQRCRP